MQSEDRLGRMRLVVVADVRHCPEAVLMAEVGATMLMLLTAVEGMK